MIYLTRSYYFSNTKIDTIIITTDHYSNPSYSVIYLDSFGNKQKEIKYCPNKKISKITLFDSHENIITSTFFGFDCEKIDTNVISSKMKNTYKDGLIIKTENIDKYDIYSTSGEYFYNNKKLIKYNDFSFGHLAYCDSFSYEVNKITKVRIGGDSHQNKIIGITKIKLDSLEREIESAYYSDEGSYKSLHSIYYSEYDKYGNLIRHAGYFFPKNELRYEQLYYYSQKSKIDSSKQYLFFDESLNLNSKTTYYYDNRKLLIKEKNEHIRNKVNTIKNYEYR